MAETTQSWDPMASLRRRWWLLVLLPLLVGGALAVTYSIRAEQFTSSARLLFDPTGQGGASLFSSSSTEQQRSLNTQRDVILGDRVVQASATATDLTPEALRADLAVDVQKDSSVVTVAFTASRASRARDVAAAVASIYETQSRAQGVASLTRQADALEPAIKSLVARISARGTGPSVEAQRTAAQTQLVSLSQQQQQLRVQAQTYQGPVSTLAAADLPTSPSSPSPLKGAAEGASLGLVLAVLLAVYGGGRSTSLAPSTPASGGATPTGDSSPRQVPLTLSTSEDVPDLLPEPAAGEPEQPELVQPEVQAPDLEQPRASPVLAPPPAPPLGWPAPIPLAMPAGAELDQQASAGYPAGPWGTPRA